MTVPILKRPTSSDLSEKLEKHKNYLNRKANYYNAWIQSLKKRKNENDKN